MFLDMVHAQERLGHEVTIVIPPSGVNYKRLVNDGTDVIPLPVYSSKLDYFAAWKLAGIIRNRKIDILHTHLTSSAQLGSASARWAGVPCVASVLKMTRKNRYMKCDSLLPCSNAVLDDLKAQNVPDSMLRRVYTGIDLSRYFDSGSDEDAREEFGFSKDDKVFGSVARLVPMKGHKFLLQAFGAVSKKHPEARLLIVGDGELRESLEEQAETSGIKDKVVFAGTRLDLKRILKTIDISVLASVEKEGLPVILVESVLMGCPVVMSDVAGISEVVKDHETGLLVKPGDVDQLVGAMCEVLERPKEAAERMRSALDFVKREFDVNYTTAQIDEVYKKLSVAEAI
ncbi:MAG TPA: glycosyltransferase [bacterium]|nr:glycosyltransferase [bacterium]